MDDKISVGLTPKKKEELKQMMGEYSGKADLSLLNELNRDENCERYCTPAESLQESLVEVRLMREGKLPKKSWRDLKKELEKDKD